MRSSSFRCVAAVCSIALQACTEPVFEFRGYTNLADCRHVIDAELALGATFEDAYDSLERNEPELVTELAGQLFEEDVAIEIACSERGSVKRIFYILNSQDPQETARAYIRFADELDDLFGLPLETITQGSRMLGFLCAESSPVILEEYLVSDDEHELYLGVVPAAAICMTSNQD